ncbi:MAG: preprotein translocase subunit SecE [Anaerolineae bacterium]
MAKKQAAQPEKKENRLVRYFREVRAEVRKVVWPSRQATLRLTGIVLAVMLAMSAALGLVDWVFTRLFALIAG